MITEFEHYTDAMNDGHSFKVELLEILNQHQGKEQAIIGDDICDSLSHKWNKEVNIRRLRKMVSQLRLEGYPIGSCERGYYKPIEEKEVYSTIQSLVDRKCALEAVIDSMCKMFEEEYGKSPALRYS